MLGNGIDWLSPHVAGTDQDHRVVEIFQQWYQEWDMSYIQMFQIHLDL